MSEQGGDSPWFRRRRAFGIGYNAASWQGVVAILVFVAALLVTVVSGDPNTARPSSVLSSGDSMSAKLWNATVMLTLAEAAAARTRVIVSEARNFNSSTKMVRAVFRFAFIRVAVCTSSVSSVCSLSTRP